MAENSVLDARGSPKAGEDGGGAGTKGRKEVGRSHLLARMEHVGLPI